MWSSNPFENRCVGHSVPVNVGGRLGSIFEAAVVMDCDAELYKTVHACLLYTGQGCFVISSTLRMQFIPVSCFPPLCSGSFNLDAQIAALPKCSMESFTRRKSKKKAGRPDEEGGRDDRISSDAAELGGKDPDFRPGAARGMRQRSESGASGTDEATVDDPSSPPPVSSPSDHSSATPRKFKTGDFDLDEHLAALPKCDIEVLSRRKKELRRDSGSSSGRQDSKADDSGTESDHAGASESTEENGVRDWHSGDEEESEEAGRNSPKKDKRKRRKGAVMEEDFPSSLATLADIALSQKEKMQD